MKKIETMDVIIFMTILTIIGLAWFLFSSLNIIKHPSFNSSISPTKSTELTETLGIVNHISNNTIKIIKTENNKPITLVYSISPTTTFQRTFPTLPYLDQNKLQSIQSQVENISLQDIKVNDKVAIFSESNLAKTVMSAVRIVITPTSYFVSCVIESIQDNFVIVSYSTPNMEVANSEIITRNYSVTFSPNIQFSQTTYQKDGSFTRNLISPQDIHIGDNVFIYTFDNPEITTSLMAETFNIQTLNYPTVPLSQ